MKVKIMNWQISFLPTKQEICHIPMIIKKQYPLPGGPFTQTQNCHTKSEHTSRPVLYKCINPWDLIANEAINAVLGDCAINVSANACWERSSFVAQLLVEPSRS
jgi:hypothetical protein